MAAERGLSSLFLGVHRRGRKFIAKIHISENIYIGIFPTEADAARAYDIIAKATRPPTWVRNFSTDEDYEEFRKLENPDPPSKDLFNAVEEKAKFFREALARGESMAAAFAAWKTRMDLFRPGDKYANLEGKLAAYRAEYNENPSCSWKDRLAQYKVFKLEHLREPREVGKSLDVSKRPLEFFLAQWAARQKQLSKVGASSRGEYRSDMPPFIRILFIIH